MSDHIPGEDELPKKKRGRYKQYLTDPSLPIPRTTLFSRMQSAQQTIQQQQADQQIPADGLHQDLEQHELVDAVVYQEEPPVAIEHSAAEEQPLAAHYDQTHQLSDEQITEENHDATHVKKEINYVEKYHLTERLHPDFSTSRLDALLMILHLAIRHCHTQHFIEDQIEFVNVLFGSNVLDVSHHIFKNLFKPSVKISKHFFCSECDIHLGSQDNLDDGIKVIKCTKCPKEIDVKSVTSGDYFITLPIKKQIEDLLKKTNVNVIPRCQRTSENIADIFDGTLYKKLLDSPFEQFLTVTFNTDGVAVHESTKNSLWPILLYVNEICPEERFKTENLIVAGLWFGRSAPNMSLFLKPFTEELLQLSVSGVDFVSPDGITVQCPVFPLNCSVDSVAKPKLLCQKQFNAYYGCLYCFHPNDSFVGDNRTQRYYDTTKSYNLRSEESVISDMMEADKLQRQGQLKQNSVNGFMGISILLMFTKLLEPPVSCSSFNTVWSVVIDYMHCILEGVTADLLNLFDCILSSQDLKRIDDRCKVITPPQNMTRRPRSYMDRTKWKAKEFRAFILYYALPCLEDLLPQRNFTNLKLFINAVHILLSDNISPTLLAQAKNDLHNFTIGYQRLYGLSNVSYNLHLCTHLADLVERAGPLWSYSNFVFESGNGVLLNLLRGTKSVINEIAVKYSIVRTSSNLILKYNISPAPLKFCRQLMKYCYSNCEVSDVHLTSQSSVLLTDQECELLGQKNVLITNKEIFYYHRAICKGIIYCSKSYSKSKVYNDSCVLLNDGTYAVIDKIVKSSADELLCVIKPIQIAQGLNVIAPIHKCAHIMYDSVSVVPFDHIQRKCVLVTFEGKGFVCHIPNLYERD